MLAGSTLNHWPFPERHLPEGYAYLLTHPGTPCVFWDHWQDGGALGDNVGKLIKARQQHGLHCRSKVRPPQLRGHRPALRCHAPAAVCAWWRPHMQRQARSKLCGCLTPWCSAKAGGAGTAAVAP